MDRPTQRDVREQEKISEPTTQLLHYEKPAIIHELELETKVGSPLNIDPFDIINPGG